MFGGKREVEMLWRQVEELGLRLDHVRDDIKELDERRRDDKSNQKSTDDRLSSRMTNSEGHINNLYGHHQISALRSQALGQDFVPPPAIHEEEDPDREEERLAMLEKMMGDPMGAGYNAEDLIDETPKEKNAAEERPKVDTPSS